MCNFCSINPHLKNKGSSWRGKSNARIVEEFERVRKFDPDVTNIRFVDSDFFDAGRANGRNGLDLAQQLMANGFNKDNVRFFIETQAINILSTPEDHWEALREAGLHNVFIGVESGNIAGKKRIGKRSSIEDDERAIEYLRRIGVNITYGFIMFDPWVSVDEVRQNITALRNLGDADLGKYFSEMILNPGTRAFNMASAEGLITPDIHPEEGWEMYSYSLPTQLRNVRAVGHLLLGHSEFQHYLKGIFSIYESVKSHIMNGNGETAVPLRREIDDVSARIFESFLDLAPDQRIWGDDEVVAAVDQVMGANWESVLSVRYRLDSLADE